MNNFQRFKTKIKKALAYSIGFLVGVVILLIAHQLCFSLPFNSLADIPAFFSATVFTAWLFIRLWFFKELAIYNHRKSLANNTIRLIFWELYLIYLFCHSRRTGKIAA